MIGWIVSWSVSLTTTGEGFAAAVAVVGGGPAGLVSAIACAAAGIDVALIAPAAPADNRTTALLSDSVTALEMLGVWRHCVSQAAPLRRLRLPSGMSTAGLAPCWVPRPWQTGHQPSGLLNEKLCGESSSKLRPQLSHERCWL